MQLFKSLCNLLIPLNGRDPDIFEILNQSSRTFFVYIVIVSELVGGHHGFPDVFHKL